MAWLKIVKHPHRLMLLVGLLGSLMAMPASAGTIVKVQTALGNFYLELADEAAPETVENFLNYVRSGRYDNTFIHTVQSGGLLMGGGFGLNDCAAGPVPITTDGTIPFEDTGLSNLSGTIAMAHWADDVNSAESQWFINVANDTSLDTLNGGYAVFGEVVGNGYQLIDLISQLPTTILSPFADVPVINYLGFSADCNVFSRDNLVMLLMSVEAEDNGQASSNFDNATGLLNVNVNLGSLGFMNLSFSIQGTEPQTVIQAELDSVVELDAPVPDMAQFDVDTGELLLPELAVDGTILFRNVVFTLSDETNALFTLTSFE